MLWRNFKIYKNSNVSVIFVGGIHVSNYESKIFFSSQIISVSMSEYMRVCRCMCMCVHVHVEVREQPCAVAQVQSPYVLRQTLSLSWELLIRVVWPASEPQSLTFHLPNVEVASPLTCSSFYVGTWDSTQVLMLCGKKFSNWTFI